MVVTRRRVGGILIHAWLLPRFLHAGVFQFHHQTLPAWVAPPWIMALWMAFASTLRSSLGWLAQRYWLAASLGAIAGPLAYYTGHKLGALSFPSPVGPSLAALAVVWAILMPTVMWMSILGDNKALIAKSAR